MQDLREGRGYFFAVNMKHLDLAFPLNITMQHNLCDSGQIDDSPYWLSSIVWEPSGHMAKSFK